MKRIAVVGIAVAVTVRVALALETPYVTDGLVAMWDAIENVGPGLPHDSAATTWVNLVDPDKYAMAWVATYGSVSWSETAANFSRTQGADGCGFFSGVFAYAAEMGVNWTIEVMVNADEGYFNNYSGICGNGRGGTLLLRLPYFGQYENGSLVTRTHLSDSPADSGVSVPRGQLKLNTLQTLSFSDSPTTFGFYIDGAAVASGVNGSAANSTLSDSADFRIGNCTEDLDRMFSGKIHCVRIYNRVLTDAERKRNNAVDFERYESRLVSVQSTSDVLPDDFFSPGRGVHLGYAQGDTVTCTASADPLEVEDWGVVSNATVTGWTLYTNSPSAFAWAEWRKGDGTTCTFDHPGVNVRMVWDVGFTFVSRDSDPIRSYVHDGLVAMWDASRNAGVGRPHDNSATTWRNLVNTNKYALTWNATNGKVNWSDDAAGFTRTQGADGCGFFAGAFAYAAEMGANWTIEATVVADEGYFNNYSGICGNGNGGTLGKRLPYFGQYENGSLVTRVHDVQSGGTSGVSVPSGKLKLNALQTLSFSDSPTTFGFYIDGAAVASGLNGSAANSTLADLADFHIGNCTEDLDRMFSGKIHCVRIYNRVLTDAERKRNVTVDFARYVAARSIDVRTSSDMLPDDFFSPNCGVHLGYAPGDSVTCTASAEPAEVEDWGVVSNATVTGWTLYTNSLATSAWAEWRKGDGTTCTFDHPGVGVRVVWNVDFTFVSRDSDPIRGYVHDGLVAMWDAIDNGGFGQPHDNEATTWVNLVDPDKYAMTWVAYKGERLWSDDAAVFTRSQLADSGWSGSGWWSTSAFPYAALMGTGWTMEASVEPLGGYVSNYSGICGNGNGGYLPTFGQNENGVACFRVYGVRANPGTITLETSQTPIGELQTITYSDTPTNASVWVNDALQGSLENGSANNSTLGASGDFRIGVCYSGGNYVFDGEIHCVRVYNRVLTAAERHQNYVTDMIRFGGMPKADTVTVVGDPQDVPSDLVSPSYGMHGGYGRGETVTCVAPIDAVSIKCDTVISNAQVVGYEIYTNVVGDLAYALMKKGKGTTCTFAHPGSATRVVWMWELSEVPNEEVTVGAYVTDGLIAMWDGENNAGLGSHSPNTTTWNNLVDATKWSARWSPMSSGTVRWKDKCASFVNQHHTGHGVEGHGSFSAGDANLGAAMGDTWTIEASARPTQYYFNNYAGICGSDSSSAYICQYEAGKVVTRVYKAGAEKAPSGFQNIPAADFKADALWTVSFADSPTNMCFSTNGCVCATDVNKVPENSTVSGSFSIGTGSSSDARLFDGDIYNVRIYNRYLTADEIARNAFIDRVRFDGMGGVRYLGGVLQCLTRVQTFGPVTASVNGGEQVTSFAEWNDYSPLTVTIAAETAAPRCVWRTTAGVPEGNALTVTTAGPVDVVLDAYDPSAANQRVVDVAADAGAVNAVAIGSLAGIQRIHVGAVEGGAGAAELTLGGKLRITVSGNGYAIVEPDGRSVGRAKIVLFNGAQLTALDDAEVGDLVLFGGSMIELNGHALRYHSTVHRNRVGWDSGAKVVDSVGGGTFGYERLTQGMMIFLR